MNLKAETGARRPIRVLLADDSPLALEIIGRMLGTASDIAIVAVARNGNEALELVRSAKPDVVCTDYHMPVMDGLALTRELMRTAPLPILVMSTSLQPGQKNNIFAMLDAGALDVLAKPAGGLEGDSLRLTDELIEKIRVLSGVKVFRRRPAVAAVGPALAALRIPQLATPPRIIGIGASTGGPQALEAILKSLPSNFPVPLVCVQHISQGFVGGLVSWLSDCCRIGVRIAEHGAIPTAGTAYFAADDRHIEVDAAGCFRLSSSRPVDGHRPSIDLAMRSLARCYGSRAMGVLLTGMGQDGAAGLLDIHRAGGFTVAQDEGTSIVYGMPRHAVELGAAGAVMPLPRIAEFLRQLAADKKPV